MDLRGVGWGGVGNMIQNQTSDFRFPEVGISEYTCRIYDPSPLPA